MVHSREHGFQLRGSTWLGYLIYLSFLLSYLIFIFKVSLSYILGWACPVNSPPFLWLCALALSVCAVGELDTRSRAFFASSFAALLY
jgi:hypothetical protein